MMNRLLLQKLITCFILIILILPSGYLNILVPKVQAAESTSEVDQADPSLELDEPEQENNDVGEAIADDSIALDRAEIERKGWQYLADAGKVPKQLPSLVTWQNQLTEMVLGGSFDRIYFENPIDEFATFGEPCTPPANVGRWLCTQEEGDDWIRATDSNGRKIHEADDIFPNNVWDGPELVQDPNQPKGKIIKSIVDARIIEMLRYLTTPTWLGGAGRERVGVKKIVQFNENDREQVQEDEGGEEPMPQKSAHYIGEIREGRRVDKTIQAIDISEIDSVRITTKITKKKRVGGDKTSYKFQRPFGVKVAWQDDYGINRAGVPPVDVLTGAEDFFKAGIIDLLSDMEITEALSPGDLSGVGLRDIAQFVGSELLASILNSRRGSLSGFDLEDTLEKFGRSVIADELKLPRQAFASGNSVSDIERNIGQAILEKRFGLPEGAFAGDTSPTILNNIGRRWLEEEVFEVRSGTLDYQLPEKGRDVLFYQKLGAGRLERQFNFAPGTFDPNQSFAKIKERGGLRFDFIFDKDGKNDVYIDELLGITMAPTNVNPGSDPPSSIRTEATNNFRQSKNVKEYLGLIGQRVFEQSLGTLNQNIANPRETVAQFARENGISSPLNRGILTSTNNNIVQDYRKIITDVIGMIPLAVRDPFLPDSDYQKLVNSDSVSLTFDLENNRQRPLQIISQIAAGNDAVVAAVSEIEIALKEDLKIINQALKKAYDGVNRDELAKLAAGRKRVIEALERVRSGAYQYLEAVFGAKQFLNQSPADQAAALTPSGFLADVVGYDNRSLTNRLREGDLLTALPTIGLIKLSQKTADNSQEQAAIQLNLFENTQSFFDLVSQTSQDFGLGLSEAQIRGRFGLVSGDYDRIFLQNMGADVFQRIGKAELLAAVWQHPAFQEQVEHLRQNQTYQDIEQFAAEAQNELTFYTSRLNEIAGLYQNQIVEPMDRLINLDEATKEKINQKIREMYPANTDNNLSIDFVRQELQKYYRSVHITSVGGAFEFISQTQRYTSIIIAAAQILNTDSRTQGMNEANTVWQAVNQIRHKLQEIAAGRALEYERPDNLEVAPLDLDYSQATNQNRQSKCWSANQLIAILAPAGERDIGNQLESGLKVVGACEIDKKLTLPIGAMYGFYKDDDHGLESFKYSVGAASFKERGLDVPSDAGAVREEGRNILTSRVLRKLALQSGVFRNLTKKYPMTEETIWLLVSGDSEAAAVKFGGSLIDSRLHLTPGTVAELINPCAATEILAVRDLDSDCKDLKSKDREEVRLHVLAREGLRQLGLELDIPANTDFASGNFRDNLGRAQFEETLGLSDFQGASLDQVIAKNGETRFLSAIGAPSTPYAALLAELGLKLREELAREPYVGDVVDSPIAKIFINKARAAGRGAYIRSDLKTLERLLKAEQSDLLQKLRSATENHYYWWTDSSSPPLSALDEDSSPVREELVKIQNLSSQLSGYLSEAVQDIINQAKESSKEQLVTELRSNVTRFHLRIGYFDERLFKLDGPNNGIDVPDVSKPSMKAVIWGQTSPDKLNEDFGKIALWHLGVQVVDQKFADTFIGQASKEYRQFQEMVRETNDGTKIPSLEEIFAGNGLADNQWEDLFTGKTDASINARTWFFDRFLARSFSMKFDQQMGVEAGTTRNLFAMPHLAREIAIDQGMNRLAAELFRADQGDSNDLREGKYALLQVFNAGFLISCSTANSELPNNEIKNGCKASGGRDFYSLDFRRQRAFGRFRELVNDKLGAIVGEESRKYLGTTIPLSDLNAFVHGDLRTLGFIAAAFTVKQVNTQSDGQVLPAERRLDYTTARLATVGDSNAPAVLAAGEQASQNFEQEYIRSVCGNNCSETSLDQAIIIRASAGMSSSEQEKTAYEENKQAAISAAHDRANRQIREAALKRFQYQIMDAGLYKIDENFPLGFAEMFFSSNATAEDRNDALLLFGINHLSKEGSWGDFFSAFNSGNGFNIQSVRDLRGFLNNLSCSGTSGAACREQFFGGILSHEGFKNFFYQNFTGWFASAFGTDLQEEIFDGMLAWGATGNLNGSFTVGDKTIKSLSDSIEGWAQNRIFAWADRSLGFEAGTASQLYDAGKQLYQAFKQYDFIRSHNVLDVGLKFGDETLTDDYFSAMGNRDAGPEAAKKATEATEKVKTKGTELKKTNKAHLKEAQAQFITFALTTIFKSQIASMESKLGLVPGTGAMAVGMLVNLAMGVPIDPITIALFIGLNLFGYYKIVVKAQGTADGYYPFVGNFGDYTFGGFEIETSQLQAAAGARTMTKQRRVNFQYPSPDPPIGEFEAQNSAGYKDGLKKAARAKIEGLLIDLATAPERWAEAEVNNYKSESYTLMPSQVFTKLPEHIDAVQGFISRPPCTSQKDLERNGGCGYGQIEKRRYSGFWANTDPADISFWDHLHVAW